MERTEAAVAGKDLSRIGSALFLMIATSAGAQFAVAGLTASLPEDILWLRYVLLFAVQYLIAMPLAALVIKSMPAYPPAKRKAGVKEIIFFTLISFTALYFGSVAGSIITRIISAIAGSAMSDLVLDVITGAGFWVNLATAVIAAPIAEELFYRKLLIGRLSVFGDKGAIFISALVFGLMHGNFSQVFYAFALGLVFGYIYVRTGRVIYTIALHMTINFFGGVLAPLAISSGSGFQFFYAAAVLGMALAGLVLFITNVKKICLHGGERRLRTVSYVNPGMILFFSGCAALFVLNTCAALI